jgi:hypothetical protein
MSAKLRCPLNIDTIEEVSSGKKGRAESAVYAAFQIRSPLSQPGAVFAQGNCRKLEDEEAGS